MIKTRLIKVKGIENEEIIMTMTKKNKKNNSNNENDHNSNEDNEGQNC